MTRPARLLLACTLGFLLVQSPSPAVAQDAETTSRYETALAFYRQGDWTTAERLLQELLGDSPDHHPARWTLATLYVRTGRPDTARRLVAEIAQREGGELGVKAKTWLAEMDASRHSRPPFTPDASGSVALSEPQAGFVEASFPTAPLTLRIPQAFALQGSEVKRLGEVIQARYRFAPDAQAARRLGVIVEVTTLPKEQELGNHRVLMIRELLSRDGLSRTTPFREQDVLLHGHLARYLGYMDPAVPGVNVLALGIATERYRVILRAACHETELKEQLPKLQATLSSLRIR